MIQVTCNNEDTEARRFARAELERYLHLMGVDAARIVLRVEPGGAASDEAYGWAQDGDTITLTAGGNLGLVFGVYALLRDVGGCRFSGLGADGEYVPSRAALPTIDEPVHREPALWYRGIQFSNACHVELHHQQIDWMAKNGFNYLMVMVVADESVDFADFDPATGEPVDGGRKLKSRITEAWMDKYLLPEARKRGLKLDVNHHNLRFWLPPSKHMQTHPQWYAEHDGERGSNMQQLCICTSNDDAIAALIDSIRQFLRRRPDVRIVGVIPEDGNGMCQCAACRAMDVNPHDADRPHNFRDPDDENRSLADRYARLLNEVATALADEFPDVLIGGAAYVDAQWPSRDIALARNITLWFATYWRDGARPLREGVDSHINTLFVKLIKQWRAKLTAPLILYSYYMGMNAQRGLPYPMARAICGDWAYLKTIGVQGATVQCLASCHDAYGLNLAAFARSAWEDRVDFVALLDDYLLGMFGAAAPALRPIYEGLERAIDAIGAHTPQSIMPGPVDETWFLQPTGENAAFFMRYLPDVDAALAEARSAAATQRERRQVERFARYMHYVAIAAQADDEAAMREVIAYLEEMPLDGWFAASAPSRWAGAIKRL